MRGLLACFLVLVIQAQAVDVLTSEYNLNRTGHNPSETILTQSNVAGGTFGLLGSYPVDGTVYGRVLALDAYPFSGGTKSAIFVATSGNSIYAYDQAVLGSAGLIWKINVGAPLFTALIPGGLTHGAPQWLAGNIGCMATPVIDRTAGLLYEVCSDGTTGSITTGWKIHRIVLTTGLEASGSPTQISNVLFAGAGDQFSSPVDTQSGANFNWNGTYEVDRAPLALANGNLYTIWTAYGDVRPGHGMVISFNATTMAVNGTWTCSPSPTSGNSGLCSIWQSGRGVPIDASGNLYVATGNGGFDGTANFADCWVKLTSGLALSDWYSPSNNSQINTGDWDISSAGPILVPSTVYLVQGSKDRIVRVMNTGNMGHLDPNNGTSPTTTVATNACNTGCAYQASGIYNGAYSPYDGLIYQSDVSGPLYGLAFNTSTGVLSAPSVQTAESFGFPGAFISVSYNGSSPVGTDIVWANVPANGQPGFNTHNAFAQFIAGRLLAFNAATLAVLYDSAAAPRSRDDVGVFSKFQPPMPINGRVYLPTNIGVVDVFGLGVVTPPAPTPAVVGYR